MFIRLVEDLWLNQSQTYQNNLALESAIATDVVIRFVTEISSGLLE